MIGTTISHYTILEKLGERGMGVVYKARDTRLDRFVALKLLPPHVSTSPDDKTRFIREAKAAPAHSHPDICTVFGVEESEEKTFIVMEYVEGKILQDMKATPVEVPLIVQLIFRGYDVDADGTRFLVNVQSETQNQTPLSLVVNWDAGLKKK